MSRRARTQKALSVGHGRSQGCAGCFVPVFCSVFLIAGAAMAYFMTVRPLYQVFTARNWLETPCTIRSSEVQIQRGDESDSHIIDITYDYEFEGQPYVGDRYHFAPISTNTSVKWKRQVVREHPPGHKTVCYVHPDDPEQSVIERGLTREMWWGLFPIPFLAVGIGGVVFGSRLSRKSKAAGDAESTAGPQQLLEASESAATDGPRVLKPSVAPVAAFGVALLICLFWNGITSVFVWHVVQSFLDGKPEWLLTLFMTPFVLIGLGLLAVSGYLFLAIFNPRPELTLSRGRSPLGSLCEVRWQFRGSIRSVRNFKLVLKGEEKATYRRGTDTHTDTSTFFEHLFYEAGHPVHIATGHAECEVPADSMHSFSADHNQINWSLEVAADIPFWPDISLSFPLEVTPHESTANQHA